VVVVGDEGHFLEVVSGVVEAAVVEGLDGCAEVGGAVAPERVLGEFEEGEEEGVEVGTGGEGLLEEGQGLLPVQGVAGVDLAEVADLTVLLVAGVLLVVFEEELAAAGGALERGGVLFFIGEQHGALF
jgi:hypothetical protein